MLEPSLINRPENDSPLKIKILETRKVSRAKINGEILIKKSPDCLILEVGNTGLKIRFSMDNNGKYDANFDFAPGGKIDSGKIHPLTAMKILCYGLDRLRSYMNDLKIADNFGVEKFRSITNPVFLNFILKLFDSSGHPELVHKVDENSVEIDLNNFLLLTDDDNLISKIKRFSELAKNLEFDALVKI